MIHRSPRNLFTPGAGLGGKAVGSAVFVVLVGAFALLSLATASPAAAQVGSGNPHGNLSSASDCTLCHRSDSWTPVRSPMSFVHSEHTAFPLRANHADVLCARCHIELRFDEPNTPVTDCGACHVDVHQNKLGTDCASCHRETSFADVQPIEIHAQTFFPLTGAHLQLPCASCHADERRGAFAGQDATCVNCHRRDYTRSIAPNHVVAGTGVQCEQCHGTLGWRPATDIPG